MAVGTSLAPRKVMVVADPTHESAAALQYALSHGITDQDELILLHVESPAGSWTSAFSTLFRRHSNHYHHHDRQRQHHHHRHIFHSQHRGRLRHHAPDASYTSAGAGEGGSSTAVQRATGGLRGRETEFLEEMKSVCELAQPKVRVRIERAENKEGKDKASVILHRSTMHGVDVLIVGQRRSLSTAILGCRRSSAAGGSTKEKDTAEYLIKHSKCDCVGVQRKGQNAGYLLNTKTCRNFWLLA